MDISTLNWRVLSGVISRVKAMPSFLYDRIFTNRQQVLSDKIDVDIRVGGKSMAPFVSPEEAAVVIVKEGRKVVTVTTPRIRIKKPFTAQELLTVRGLGVNVYSPDEGGIQRAQDQLIANEAADLKNQILRRTEWLCAQALQGKISVAQDNISFEVDFLFPTAHKPSLTGTDRWSDTTNADPTEDIYNWKRLIAGATGLPANLAICGKNVPMYLKNNTKVKDELHRQNLQIGQLDFEQGNYVGRLAGVDIYLYDHTYKDAAGTEHSFIPDDAFIIVAPTGPFRFYYGIILDHTEVPVASQFFSKLFKEEDPPMTWMLGESRPLPVPYWPECVVCATVHS